MKYIDLRINEPSVRTIQGSWEFDRNRDGILQIPASSSFPTASYAGELFWNELSGALYVRNQLNNEWILAGSPRVSASYLLLSSTGSLPNERTLSVSSNLRGTDAGANSTYTLAINDNFIATISGSRFTGPVVATSGFSGSLQQTSAGLSYLNGTNGLTLASQSNGQINISYVPEVSGDSLDQNASLITLTSESTLNNDRVLNLSGSGISATDNGSTLTLDVNMTGSVTGTSLTFNGRGVAVNDRGFITSGSTTWFGQNFTFITGSSAVPFSNATTTYRAVLSLTASNITPGIYRFGWVYVFYTASTSVSLKFRCTLLTSASYNVMEELSEVGANERLIRTGFALVRVPTTSASFDLQMATESGTAASRVYDRALEFWRVS